MPGPTPLNLAYPLDPRGDQTVSLIRSRKETEALMRAETRIDEAVARGVRDAARTLERRGKLSREDLVAFHAAFEGAVSSPGIALDRRTDAASIAAASGAGFESQAIHISPANVKDKGRGPAGHVQIRLATLTATRTGIAYSSAPFVCDWRHHAAERVHLRMQDRGDAHAAIGSRLLEVYRLVNHLAAETATRDRDIQVPVPMAGGLLMGSLDIAQPGVATPSIHGALQAGPGGPTFAETQIDRVGRGLTDATARGGSVPTWTAMTFISPNDMTPERIAYAKGFEQLQAIARTADAQPDGLLRKEDQQAFTNASRILVDYGIAKRIMPRIPQPREVFKATAADHTRIDLTPMRRGIVEARASFGERIAKGHARFAAPSSWDAPTRGPAWKTATSPADGLRRDVEIDRLSRSGSTVVEKAPGKAPSSGIEDAMRAVRTLEGAPSLPEAPTPWRDAGPRRPPPRRGRGMEI